MTADDMSIMQAPKKEWSIEEHIELFRRQFLQLEDLNRLALPPPDLVKKPDMQRYVYNTMFRDGCLAHAPPSRYKLRVLKKLVEHLEQSVADPDEDVWLFIFFPLSSFLPLACICVMLHLQIKDPEVPHQRIVQDLVLAV